MSKQERLLYFVAFLVSLFLLLFPPWHGPTGLEFALLFDPPNAPAAPGVFNPFGDPARSAPFASGAFFGLLAAIWGVVAVTKKLFIEAEPEATNG